MTSLPQLVRPPWGEAAPSSTRFPRRSSSQSTLQANKLAAAWSRKLPSSSPGATTKAAYAVRSHLLDVQESIQRRHPSRLEEALHDAHGTPYLDALSSIRRSRSTPALQRHALEVAMATHLVNARATLGKWKQGVREIDDAHQRRNAEHLRGKLSSWKFSKDLPLVAEAHKNLERWKYQEDILPPILQDALEKRDIFQIRSLIKDVIPIGDRTIPGFDKASQLLEQYDAQSHVLKEGLKEHRPASVERALASWTFDEDDPLVVDSRKALIRRESQLEELCNATNPQDGGLLDGERLERACKVWEFENNNEEHAAAALLVEKYHEALHDLDALLSAETTDYAKLRAAVDSWTFADNCHSLATARHILASYDSKLRHALAKKDVLALRTLMPSFCQTSKQDDLTKTVLEFLATYDDTTQRIYTLLNLSSEANFSLERDCTLSSVAAQQMSKLVAAWEFAYPEEDWIFDLAKQSLHLHGAARAGAEHEIQAAVGAQNAAHIRGSLRKHSDKFDPEETVLLEAHKACAVNDRAMLAAWAISFGVPPSYTGTANKEVESAKRSIMPKYGSDLCIRLGSRDMMKKRETGHTTPICAICRHISRQVVVQVCSSSMVFVWLWFCS